MWYLHSNWLSLFHFEIIVSVMKIVLKPGRIAVYFLQKQRRSRDLFKILSVFFKLSVIIS